MGEGPSEGAVRYTVTQQSPLQSPDAMPQLMTASASLFACLVALIVANYKIKQWLKS
jgi:hypothetical protein